MPPLAITNRGGKVFRVRLTTATTAADTVRAIRRLSAASSVLIRRRLVWTMTSPPWRASTTSSTVLSRCAAASAGPGASRRRSPRCGRSCARSVRALSWRVVTPTCEPTTIRPPASEGFCRRKASSPLSSVRISWPIRAADERRTHAVEEFLAAAFGFFEAEGQGAEVVLGDDVRHDRGGVGGRVDGVGDGLGGDGGVLGGCAGADGVQVQDDDGVGGEPALRLFLHVVRHARRWLKPKLASLANSVSETGISVPAASPVPRM